MNYIKKIKSIGFKKCQNIVVCEFIMNNPHRYSLKIVNIDKVDNIMDVKYPRCISEDLKRLQTYVYKINKETLIYIILLKEEYTVISCRGTNIKSIINSKKLNDSFWKEALSSLDKDIQREFLLKDIFSYKQ